MAKAPKEGEEQPAFDRTHKARERGRHERIKAQQGKHAKGKEDKGKDGKK
jgi:hypothetical protein